LDPAVSICGIAISVIAFDSRGIPARWPERAFEVDS
jgi:hypothetical protein